MIKKVTLKFTGPLKPFTQPVVKLIQHHMAHPTWDIFNVHTYHRNTNKWLGIGYNYFIDFEGQIFEGRGMNIGAHAGANWNGRSLGIGYQGDFTIQQMTDAQLIAGVWLNAKFIKEYGLSIDDIIGHKDISTTQCPGLNFRMQELKDATILGLHLKEPLIIQLENENKDLKRQNEELQSKINQMLSDIKQSQGPLKKYIQVWEE